jgi:hypothetical protein
LCIPCKGRPRTTDRRNENRPRTNEIKKGVEQELLKEEMLAMMEANQERVMAKLDAYQEKIDA